MLAATTGAGSLALPPAPPARSYHPPSPLQHPHPGSNPVSRPFTGMPTPHLGAPHHTTPPLTAITSSMYSVPPGSSMPPPQYYRDIPPPVPVPASVATAAVPSPAPAAAAPAVAPTFTGAQTFEPSARVYRFISICFNVVAHMTLCRIC